MEPLVVFGAALVVWCACIAFVDMKRDRPVAQSAREKKSPARGDVRGSRRSAAARGRGGAAAARWPVPAGGSA